MLCVLPFLFFEISPMICPVVLLQTILIMLNLKTQVMSASNDYSLSHDSISNSSIATDDKVMSERLESMRDFDRVRYEFIENLMQEVQGLRLEREENVKILRSKEMLVSAYQDRFEASEKQIDRLQKAIDCNMFVLILIDGDDTLFKDEYVQLGLRGGEHAARELQQNLFDYFRDKQYFKHDHSIVTKIYLKLEGLSSTYRNSKILANSNTFLQFVQGFNQTYTLMDIIDAGNGKEGADSNIAAEIGLYKRNLHCKQILLAASGDNSYGHLLRRYAPNSGKCDKITLVEALPFEREIKSVLDKFGTVRFDKIFRNTKIVSKIGSIRETNITSQASSSKAALKPVVGLSAPATYANKASSIIIENSSNENTRSSEHRKSPPSDGFLCMVYVNELGQRIDKPGKTINKELFFKLKQRKLCNKYHLGKDCSFGECCTHHHGPALTDIELENLRHVARLKPCNQGLSCNNVDCIDGHRCQYGTNCVNWGLGQCWFSDDMHKVELHNIKAIPAKA